MWIPLWVHKQFDRYADEAARPVRGRHLIGLAGFGILLWTGNDSPSFAITIFVVLLWLAVALSRRHESLQYFRAHGIDPYNKHQVKEEDARLHRELQEKGIIPPD